MDAYPQPVDRAGASSCEHVASPGGPLRGRPTHAVVGDNNLVPYPHPRSADHIQIGQVEQSRSYTPDQRSGRRRLWNVGLYQRRFMVIYEHVYDAELTFVEHAGDERMVREEDRPMPVEGDVGW